MAISGPGEWEQLRDHALLLSNIQNKLFEQIRNGDIVDDKSADSADIMPRIFAIESALVPLGSLSMVSGRLREAAGYVKLEDYIQRDNRLRDLSIEFLRDKPRAAQFAALYKEHGETILSFVDKIRHEHIAPKPYGRFVEFDMEVWALACLLDIKDVFFQRVIDKSVAKQKDFGKRIDDLVSNRLNDFTREGRLGINSTTRVGWYASMATMERISELLENPVQQRNLLRQYPNVARALERVGGQWEQLIDEVVRHDGIAETILLSTRAVCAFVVLAHDVLASQELDDGGQSDVSAFFEDIEKHVLRTDGFASFCLERLSRYKQVPRLPIEDIDPFIHLTGILAFALSKGYFAPPESQNRDELRESLKQFGFDSRGEIIDTIVDKFERDVSDLLVRDDSDMYTQENRLVATAELGRLYADDGTLRELRTIKEKSKIGNDDDRDDHSFEFVVSLPIAVKALAQLSLDERLDRMTAISHDSWNSLEFEFAPWLRRVETLGEKLVAAMSEINVRRSGNTAWGVWKGNHDWSVTASVVDALSLWCAALACRYALNERTGIVTDPSEIGAETKAEFTSEDQKIVAAFFGLLKQHTTPHAADRSDSGFDESLEWLRISRQVISSALNYDPRNTGLNRDRNSKSLGLENAFRVVAIIQHIRRELGTPAEILVPTVCSHIKQVLELPKLDAIGMFSELCSRIKKEFAGAFSAPGEVRPKAASKNVEH